LPPYDSDSRPDEAQAFVNERIAHGPDYIKVIYDNGPRFAAMSKATLAAIVECGALAPQDGDSPCRVGAGYLDVIDSGADGLAHVRS